MLKGETEQRGQMSKEELTVKQLIDTRVRECLEEMIDRPPSECDSLAGTVEKLLRARPLAKEGAFDVLEILKNYTRGPQALDADPSEQ